MSTDTAVVDDEADLETADDGSKITDDHHQLENERARDERGRFVSETEEETEEEEPEKKPEKTETEAAPEKDEEKEEHADEEKAEGEEEAAEEEEEAAKPNRMSRRIMTLTEKNQAAEQRLRQLEAELAAERLRKNEARASKSELETLNEAQTALYEQVEQARADGDVKTAARLQRDIDANNRKIVTLENEPRVAARTAAAVESTKFNDLLVQVEQRIPELDQNSPDFNQDAAREMEFQIQAYERMGVKSSMALRRAALLLYGVDMDKPPKVGKAEEETENPPPKKPLVKPTKVQRNLDASKRGVPTPAATAPEIEEGRINIADLSDEEFDALPESKLDELGGNVIRSGKRK